MFVWRHLFLRICTLISEAVRVHTWLCSQCISYSKPISLVDLWRLCNHIFNTADLSLCSLGCGTCPSHSIHPGYLKMWGVAVKPASFALMRKAQELSILLPLVPALRPGFAPHHWDLSHSLSQRCVFHHLSPHSQLLILLSRLMFTITFCGHLPPNRCGEGSTGTPDWDYSEFSDLQISPVLNNRILLLVLGLWKFAEPCINSEASLLFRKRYSQT